LNAAFEGEFDDAETELHPLFNLRMPKSAPGVPSRILNPRNTWSDKAAYDAQATKLRDLFRTNFEEKGFGSLGIEPVI
jgi:phosphoenolpyruvate carboxykinase (ATP)